MRGVQWRWVLAGAGLIYGSQLLVGRLMAGYVSGPGYDVVVPAIFLAYVVGSFLFGGFLVALLSPGETVSEPALAAVAVVALDALLPPWSSATPALGSWLIVLVVGFVLALAGGWVGERIQTPVETRVTRLVAGTGIASMVVAVPAGALSLGLPVWFALALIVAGVTLATWRLRHAYDPPQLGRGAAEASHRVVPHAGR